MNDIYLLVFYIYIIYFMMTITSITQVNNVLLNLYQIFVDALKEPLHVDEPNWHRPTSLGPLFCVCKFMDQSGTGGQV